MRITATFIIFIFLLVLNSCTESKQGGVGVKKTETADSVQQRAAQPELLPPPEPTPNEAMATVSAPTPQKDSLPPKAEKAKTEPSTKVETKESLETVMKRMGLVDVQSIVPEVKVELKYSTSDNFMKKDVYGDLEKAYLQEPVAKMLAEAQKNLEKAHPGYHFVIYDAARPHAVQLKMWAIVKGTEQAKYVAPPDAKGSMHNYGCAVDLSVLDDKGKPLDMGTPFDFLGRAANTYNEADLLAEKVITQQQLDNRLILRKAMENAGFSVLKREWWHFNAYPDEVVLSKYKKVP